jgi:hypothetical protein
MRRSWIGKRNDSEDKEMEIPNVSPHPMRCANLEIKSNIRTVEENQNSIIIYLNKMCTINFFFIK